MFGKDDITRARVAISRFDGTLSKIEERRNKQNEVISRTSQLLRGLDDAIKELESI